MQWPVCAWQLWRHVGTDNAGLLWLVPSWVRVSRGLDVSDGGVVSRWQLQQPGCERVHQLQRWPIRQRARFDGLDVQRVVCGWLLRRHERHDVAVVQRRVSSWLRVWRGVDVTNGGAVSTWTLRRHRLPDVH